MPSPPLSYASATPSPSLRDTTPTLPSAPETSSPPRRPPPSIQHYSKATDLDDEDISFLTNRAAVYLEMGKGYF
ncbi:hypothetical protein OROGR_020370 [Orobanche gracilis]